MSEVIPTVDVPVQWADEVQELQKKAGTRFFLFAHEVGHSQATGHLVVKEPVKHESEADQTALKPPSTVSPKADATPVFVESLRGARAKRMSPPPTERYILLRKYEGFVVSRSEHSFWARLFENRSDYPVLEAEFDLEELSETDRGLAVEGASMVWTIGYRYEGSTRKRESAIYLRRLPPWTDKEIAESKHATAELTRGIRWE